MPIFWKQKWAHVYKRDYKFQGFWTKVLNSYQCLTNVYPKSQLKTNFLQSSIALNQKLPQVKNIFIAKWCMDWH